MRIATAFCLALPLVTGCATLTPVQPVSEVPHTARVVLKDQHHDLFRFEVFNTSRAPLVVYRDAIELQRPHAIEKRIPGGFSNTYVIAPGEHHAVNVKFDRAGLEHGDPVWIHFDQALESDGHSVDVEPIELRVN